VLEIGYRKKWLNDLASMGLADYWQKIIRANAESIDVRGLEAISVRLFFCQ
jgi:hypothetical protein